MKTINSIDTAVYRVLAADSTLGALCTVIKGAKRPSGQANPVLCVETRRIEAGEGDGVWTGDIVVTAYVDTLENRQPDHDSLDSIMSRAHDLLADTEITLQDAKALPLIAGDSRGQYWNGTHEKEVYQEQVFGIIFISF